jgi:hypothetical protein
MAAKGEGKTQRPAAARRSGLLMLFLAFARNVAPAIAGWPADIARLIALVFASTLRLAALRRCRGFLIAI